MGVTIENWTNQKLEFPELSVSEGALDRYDHDPTKVKLTFEKLVYNFTVIASFNYIINGIESK